MNWSLILNFLAAMLAIVNPVGLIPMWKELTGDTQPDVRKRIAMLVTGSAFAILLVFLNTGINILSFFSIDLAVFKIAGGILLLLTAISMVEGNATRLEEKDENAATSFGLAKQRFRKVLVPLTLPMLSGPGSLTTVILYSSKAGTFPEYVALSVVLLGTYILLCVVLAFSYKIEEKVDDLFFTAFTRLFGVIVAAISLQFIVEGLGDVFPLWLEGSSAIEPGNGK
jgi:multiple antibiotic resistance protein